MGAKFSFDRSIEFQRTTRSWIQEERILEYHCCQSQSNFAANSQSASMSWCRAHIMDVLPDNAFFSSVSEPENLYRYKNLTLAEPAVN
jgi:hypothetical protein